MPRPLARYTGSKTNASAIVNAALGRVARWYEPFGGMLSLYMQYPHTPKEVVLGDANGFAVNLWRTVAYGTFEEFEPHTLAPWSHIDLKAWARWLLERADGLKAMLAADPRAYDAEMAGRYWWWCHGRIERSMDLGKAATPGNRLRGGRYTLRSFRAASSRLQETALLQSGWGACVSEARLDTAAKGLGTAAGVAAIILDPPYDGHSLYGADVDIGEVERRALELGGRDWCRVVYFGYATSEDFSGWRRVGFKTKNGGKATMGFDGAWLSPACLTVEQLDLFEEGQVIA